VGNRGVCLYWPHGEAACSPRRSLFEFGRGHAPAPPELLLLMMLGRRSSPTARVFGTKSSYSLTAAYDTKLSHVLMMMTVDCELIFYGHIMLLPNFSETSKIERGTTDIN
jgi:hypothetical protein